MRKPADVAWTDEQRKAIAARGQNILVSAAAGSGKTAVLVERIIRRLTDKDNPVDVDRLLVVTFTNAAAAEMRQRIGEALEKALAERPADLHLRRQLALLNRAPISTLHSFCIDVLRTYYYQLSLDPGFRIVDETEAALLREEVMADLFEDYYGKEDNERFYRLVDIYSNDRSDRELQDLVERLYDFSRSHPWPDAWLDEVASRYDVDENAIEDISWLNKLLKTIEGRLLDVKRLLDQALAAARAPGGPYPYAEAIEQDLEQVFRLLDCAHDWSSLYHAFQTLRFERFKSVRVSDVDDLLKEEAKGLREAAKEMLQSLYDHYFSRPLEAYVSDLKAFAPHVHLLVELVKEFGKRFDARKMEKGVLDFSDLEHGCLRVLLGEGASSERLVPSDEAKEYQQQFLEVLVDEYQDTNVVQETILRLVAKNDNLFMVGDVKQSIYRFRLAEPELFLKKYKQFSKAGNEHGLRIDLADNFRSRKEVIDGINFIFKQIMDEAVGELDYDEDAALKYAFDYPEASDRQIELMLIDRKGANEEETSDAEEAERAQLEASLIAREIKRLIANGAEVFDKKQKRMRPVTFRDIVILMRSTSNEAETVLEELGRCGVPAYADMSSGYFEATEVSVMLALFNVIDNPDQDIPLAAVLRSPIVSLNEEELAAIRTANPHTSFFEAMKTYMRQGKEDEFSEKLDDFYDKLVRWRTRARQGALSDLIWQIYRETGYYDFVAGMPGGLQRQANLRALFDRARQYEQTSFRGLFRFLRFIERMKDLGRDLGVARALGEQEDVVRLMTIHKSKGLEFPIVFVAGLSKSFNMKDANENVLLHKTLGLGTKFIDTEKRISYPTLLQLAVRETMIQEMLAEEMRVLYVALTRAREKLYLVGTLKEAEKEIQKWQIHLRNGAWLLYDDARRKSKSYLDWIGPALIRHKDGQILREHLRDQQVAAADVYEHESTWRMSIVSAAELVKMDEEKAERVDEQLTRLKQWQPIEMESSHKADVYRRLNWQYPYQALTEIKAKQSVTELKRQRETIDEESDRSYMKPFHSAVYERPKFLQTNKLTAAERGTVMHTVMQHLPFDEDVTDESIKEKLAELVAKEILTSEQAETVDIDVIRQFFSSAIFDKIKRADHTHREIPFTFALPVKNHDEKVLVQGVVDLIVENEDGLLLVDYKTDVIESRFEGGFDEAKPKLLQRYSVQLEMYEKAVSAIWKKPVKEKFLYFFDGGHELKV